MENRNYEEYDRLIEETKEQQAREETLPEEPTADSEVSEGEGEKVNYGPENETFQTN